MRIIRKSELPAVRIDGEVAARVLDGSRYGGLSSSAFVVDAGPGKGPRRHLHPYDEIFVLVRGAVLIDADGETRALTPDEICVVPAGVVHTFTVTGPGRAQLVNIHAAGRVVTEWADEPAPGASYEYEPEH